MLLSFHFSSKRKYFPSLSIKATFYSHNNYPNELFDDAYCLLLKMKYDFPIEEQKNEILKLYKNHN